MTVNQCTCQNFFFGTYGADGSAESFEDYGTDCTATTGRLFAQGHDAKLVGYMVRAEMAGEEISSVDGGMRMTFTGAVDAAASISQALAAKAEVQLAAAYARIAKKANKPARKTGAVRKLAEAAKVVPVVREDVLVKVGRWEYRAAIKAGWATYTNAKGELVSTSNYKEV